MLRLLAVLTVAAVGPLSVECDGPRVSISGLGAVVGETVHFQHHSYPSIDTYIDVYRGIPYVEMPERFGKPQPKKPWSGDFDASQFGADCPQPGSKAASEDCLFMNIWVPNPRPSKAAVMLYIHGGAFISGSGSMETYNGVALAAYHDVIVVNFNYRLGVFGFLSTGDNELPGNCGMWDQLEALKWVKNHIADFGGDDDKITIFGESAGSASVSLMTLAKQSWGFYNRAIMQSGTASSPWSVLDPTTARDHAFKLGRVALCGQSISSSSLLSCLKQKSTRGLMLAMDFILFGTFLAKTNIIPFVPTIDGEFLTGNPAELYKRGEFKKTDVMIGTMRDEGAVIALEAFRSVFVPEESFNAIFSDYVYIKHDQAMLDQIRQHYVDPGQLNYFSPFSSLTGDEAFVCPADAVAKAFASANSNTYLYQMTHVSSFHLLPLPLNDTVPHGDDLAYVFGSAFMQGLDRPVSLTKEEIDMSADMMRYWTNFAKTGNPNMESKRGVARVSSKTWHKFNAQTLYYKDLSPSMVDRQRLRQDECYLWNVQLPQMVPSERNEEVPSKQEITDDLPEPNNLPIPGNLLTIMLIGRN